MQGIEVMRLSELFARADRLALDHALETPQRPQFHTLYVGTRGRGEIFVDFARVPLGAGKLTVVAGNRVQYFAVTPGVDAWMVLFAPEVVPPGAVPAILAPAWEVPSLDIPPEDQRELVALFELMAAEQRRAPDAQQVALQTALLHALILRADRLRGRAAAPSSPALERFFTILERDHARTRRVAHYAKAAGVSARRLGELLVAHAGKSTKAVIDERVLLEQRRLLAHTDISVKELADRTGFAEPTNLVKFFRHLAGETPLAFRARYRAK
ncbi:MAG: helix-turn-helix domain-containing protein [Deltaproteobacteria bacterium]|nr:helix-turn-helix domain-containing protein [Deltaproteobacteria bacterium]MCW5801984.1 helix-turn-helix domain-containing protein [Deltaproteobacteria bacterium]